MAETSHAFWSEHIHYDDVDAFLHASRCLTSRLLLQASMGNMTLAVHCKKSDPVDLKKPVWNYVASMYSQQQANDAMDDLGHVQQLRNTVCNLTGSLSNLRDTLARCCS